ncbi:cell division protein FtsA [Victivallis sp. Marseille-Q1083]|uniref:cell division protein FtsA n=1 Tax=Victivallis sp. Marseille-Q1083 TaxID=2717288 RepID=UPI00158A982F|nr:cell division protein FtsA [Victivallis sp. Marseille-Q1083]
MLKRRDIITAVEIGTSKICVLIGASRPDEPLTIIGRGEASGGNSVVKGEIVDMDLALEKLTEALEAADASAGREINNSRIIAMSVTGCNINSYQGVGTVFINAEDQRVSQAAIGEAIKNAQVKPLPLEQTKINTFDAFYLLDGIRRARNPENQVAHKLEAYLHVIHGDTNRIENFRSLMRDAGFEADVKIVFSAIADVYGILTDEEKENGVLLVNMGAGTTEYAVVFNMGVLASGVLPVGMEHVVNDLSLGLNLTINQCRKILQDGSLQRSVERRQGVLEMKNAEGALRRIPLSSFERIIDLRLREVFEIIKRRVGEEGILRNLASGGVLTGGAALFDRTFELFHTVFEFPVRIGRPYDASGALTDLENPRYSTVWGVLKFGEECNQIYSAMRPRGMFGRLAEAVGEAGEVGDRMLRGVGELFKSIKM